MNKLIIFLSLTLMFAISTTAFSLELMTFNIQNGGKKKQAAIIKIIKKSKAEIIGINEAYDEQTFQEIARALGYHSYRATSKKYQVGILSKYPIVEKKTLTDPTLSRAVIQLKIKRPNKPLLNVFVIHLKPLWFPSRRKKRKAEITAILKQVDLINKSEPIILMGDFNEHSHLDKPRKKTNVSKLIAAKGFADCFRQVYPSVKDHAGFTQSAKTLLIKRIDYIYINHLLKVTSARTISKNFYGPWPSDHAAVLATIGSK